MSERVTYTDLGFAAITPQELDALIAERDSLLRQIETWQEVHAHDVEVGNRAFAELAACRERLAALVAACERIPPWDQHWIVDALDAAQEELDRGTD